MDIVSEMAANVWKIVVAEGDAVTSGQELMILESMKMEIPVESPTHGVVGEILVQEGSAVEENAVLLRLA